MALLNHEPIYSESLEELGDPIGSGGFGYVCKARHKEWGFDVAIKKLFQPVGPHSSPFMREEKTALDEEADHMNKSSCEFVLRLYGIYYDSQPDVGIRMRKGIVMEFMQRGSIQTLQKDLSGPPPWPLAFRLAHQVALGITFLHSRGLIHHDLKPSNVLLSDDLNAKLADFGLATVSTSALNISKKIPKEIGGSYKYMPPEAFKASYKPVRSFDSYSFGVLLWSIFTGEEPYPEKAYSLVELRVTEFDERPSCDKLEQMEVDGVAEMVDLMKRCWEKDPDKRPYFIDRRGNTEACHKFTERLYSKHKKGIHDAVHRVLTKLDQPESSTKGQNPSTSVGPTNPPPMPRPTVSNDTVDHVRFTEKISHSVPHKSLTDEEKAAFVVEKWAKLVQGVTEVLAIAEELGDMVHDEAYSKIRAEKTNQARMRVLHDTLRSGIKVKAAFYDALKKHHRMLVESLDG